MGDYRMNKNLSSVTDSIGHGYFFALTRYSPKIAIRWGRFFIASLLCLFLAGCGQFGQKLLGVEDGKDGINGAGTIQQITGGIFNNNFTVFDSRIKTTSNITVIIGGGGEWAELPYFLPASGVNTFFIIKSGSIQIINASLAGGTGYVVTIIS